MLGCWGSIVPYCGVKVVVEVGVMCIPCLDSPEEVEDGVSVHVEVLYEAVSVLVLYCYIDHFFLSLL